MSDDDAYFAALAARIDDAGGVPFYVRLYDGQFSRSVELDPLVSAHYDATDRLIGVEFVAGTIEGLAGIDPAAASLGRRGGQKGGVARAKVLSPERRAEIARQAAETRWRRYRDEAAPAATTEE